MAENLPKPQTFRLQTFRPQTSTQKAYEITTNNRALPDSHCRRSVRAA